MRASASASVCECGSRLAPPRPALPHLLSHLPSLPHPPLARLISPRPALAPYRGDRGTRPSRPPSLSVFPLFTLLFSFRSPLPILAPHGSCLQLQLGRRAPGTPPTPSPSAAPRHHPRPPPAAPPLDDRAAARGSTMQHPHERTQTNPVPRARRLSHPGGRGNEGRAHPSPLARPALPASGRTGNAASVVAAARAGRPAPPAGPRSKSRSRTDEAGSAGHEDRARRHSAEIARGGEQTGRPTGGRVGGGDAGKGRSTRQGRPVATRADTTITTGNKGRQKMRSTRERRAVLNHARARRGREGGGGKRAARSPRKGGTDRGNARRGRGEGGNRARAWGEGAARGKGGRGRRSGASGRGRAAAATTPRPTSRSKPDASRSTRPGPTADR